MSWAKLSGVFSAQPVVRKVEQRFGLAGFGRMVKIVELLATSNERTAGRVALRPSDWIDALQCVRHELDEFLGYLQKAGWLTVAQDDEGAPLVVTLSNPAQYLPDGSDPQLFTEAAQWAEWCATDLTFPAWLINDPATQQLFRRWCAANVTTQEMAEAADLAIAAAKAVSPVELHEQLQAVRRQRLEKARG